jgi:hypothetical protein
VTTPTRVANDTVNDALKRAAELLETEQALLFPPLPLSLSAATGRCVGEAVPGLTLGEAGLFQRALGGMGTEDEAQRGVGRRSEGGQLVELIVSCVAILFLVQRCCDAGVALSRSCASQNASPLPRPPTSPPSPR